MGRFATLWFWQKSRLTAEWFEVYSFDTDERPQPSLTRQISKPTMAEPWSWSSVDDQNRLVVHLPTDHIPNAPALWYALIREYGGVRQTQTLAAFDDGLFADGTVVEIPELKRRGFEPSFMTQRVGAIRWGFGDPHLEQIFVVETHRRRRMSVKLINTADVVNVAGNWGGFIYGGDQVTEMGAKLGEAWTHSSRFREPKVHLPPMDVQ